MKKYIFLLAIATLTAVSCKKTYFCECNYSYPNAPAPEKQVIMLENQSKSDAKTQCDFFDRNKKDDSMLNADGKAECHLQ